MKCNHAVSQNIFLRYEYTSCLSHCFLHEPNFKSCFLTLHGNTTAILISTCHHWPTINFLLLNRMSWLYKEFFPYLDRFSSINEIHILMKNILEAKF